MNCAKLLGIVILILVVVVGHAQNITTGQESDSTRVAKEKASAANDKSNSFEERQAALVALEDAARLFISSGETVEAASTLNRVGRLQLDLNEPSKAMESHQAALSLLKQTSSNEIEVDNLNGLAAVHMRLSELQSAEQVLRHAISLSQQSNYKSGEAEAQLTLSDRQNYFDHVLAVETAKKALSISQSIDDKNGIANAHVQIGQYYMAQQMLSESRQNYDTALAMYREQGNVRAQAGVLIAIGFIEWRKGDWQTAIDYLTQARSLVDDRAEPLKMGQIATGLGESFYELGMPEIALNQFQRGLDYYRLGKKPEFEAYSNWQLGRTNYLLGNNSEAIRLLELSLNSVPGDSIQAAQCHESLARVYMAKADDETALVHLNAALTTYTRTVNPKEAGQTLGLMGMVYEHQKDIIKAKQFYQQALDIFARLSDQVNLAVIHFALGRMELKQENFDIAEKYLSKSIELTEDMRSVPTSSDLTAAFSATVHERYEVYIECLMLKQKAQPDQNLNIRAFETSELSRGRALVELLRATQTAVAPGVDPQLAEQEKSIRQSLRVKENAKIALLATTYKKEDLAAIDGEISQLDAKYSDVLEKIRIQYPSFEQINRPTGWNVSQIQEKIVADDDTLLLEYAIGADRSFVWAVTRNNISSHELPSETLINKAAQKVYEGLSARPGSRSANEVNQAIIELSQIVLLPVASDLNKHRILVVADGALNYVPFQVLSLPSANQEQLLVAHEVINAPSASILGQLREEKVRRQPATNVLAAFGDPVFASNYALQKGASAGEQLAYIPTPADDRMREALRDVELNGDSIDPSAIQPLFYAKQELAILHDVAGDGTFLATGFDASREKLQHTDLSKFSILHFATHGVLNPKRPEKSGLFLSTVDRDGKSQDGFVGLTDIYNLHAPVDLVVLSACRTGLGKDVRGEGLIGITRGFMYAGASSVVASLWKVDDEATAELMKLFYTNLLKRGMTPAAALSAAQNSIRQQKRWSSPYYWAAFTIQGDPRGVIKATRTVAPGSENIAVLVSLLLLMLIVGWSYRRHRLEMTKEKR